METGDQVFGKSRTWLLPTGFVAFAVVATLVRYSILVAVVALSAAIAAGILSWRRLGRRELAITTAGIEIAGVHVPWRETYYTFHAFEANVSSSQGPIVDATINIVSSAIRVARRRRRHFHTKLAVGQRGGRVVLIDDYPGARATEGRIVAAIHEHAGDDVAPFEVGAEALVHHGESLRFVEIDRVSVADLVSVFRLRESSPWAAWELTRVHNPWLLVERLLERGVLIELDLDAPPDLIAKISAAAERRAAMPRAVIHEG